MRIRLLALAAASCALIAPAAAQAQNPLRSMFDCNNAGNRQQGGAIAGALIGGLLGNQINDNDRTTGTIVGGLLGAAAGSAIGCQMTGADASRATDATRQALSSGRSSTWRAANGTAGRIDIVDTYRMSDASGRVNDPYYEDRYGYRRPVSLADVRFAQGVAAPQNYAMSDARYETRARTNVRAAPTGNSRVVNQLRSGEEFDALAMVNGGWILAGRNGEAIGYIREDVVLRSGYADTYAYNTRPSGQRLADGQLCRVFDQTVTRPGYGSSTERFTACQTARGEWVIQS
jgi:surface antigen